MGDLIRVPDIRERRRVFFTWLQASNVPTANEPVSVAGEHKSHFIDGVETESCYVSRNHQLLLVKVCV